jgi:NADH:ubiquinone oxidoreductase subunit F (NADH-binding)
MKSMQHEPSIDSFYHLSRDGIEASVCRGMTCFVAKHLNPDRWRQAASQSTRVYCLGKCYMSPASNIDRASPAIEVHACEPIVLARIANGGARTLDEYRRGRGYIALEQALDTSRERIIGEIETSGLRGRGGAGFPTGKKWRAVFGQQSDQKYVIANADEGDPGAYIDRFIMEDDPHCLIEGLAIAAYAVGATKGYIYVRNEYPEAHAVLQDAISEARNDGLLGEHIFRSPFSFDVELIPGRGSYVCGEETALLNSIEGRRPEVRVRPPYPTEHGLFGKPTLINNVETLANIPWIICHGGDAYRRFGFAKSRGTKVVSLNSLFNRPGLYEVEFGIPVRRIVEDLGGGLKTGSIKGVIIGGPLAGIIPPHLLDTLFGFDELRAIGASVGHGGVVAFDVYTSIPELIHHVFEFGAFESCGKCTPCRLGSRRIEEIFRSVLKSGDAPLKARMEWQEIILALRETSLCGLGSGLAEFAESALRYYGEELDPCFT